LEGKKSDRPPIAEPSPIQFGNRGRSVSRIVDPRAGSNPTLPKIPTPHTTCVGFQYTSRRGQRHQTTGPHAPQVSSRSVLRKMIPKLSGCGTSRAIALPIAMAARPIRRPRSPKRSRLAIAPAAPTAGFSFTNLRQVPDRLRNVSRAGGRPSRPCPRRFLYIALYPRLPSRL